MLQLLLFFGKTKQTVTLKNYVWNSKDKQKSQKNQLLGKIFRGRHITILNSQTGGEKSFRISKSF